MVADQVQHPRPGPPGQAPQGLADRRRRRAVQDPGHPVLGGAGDLEQVEDVAAEGEQHLARMPLEGVEQLAQLGRGREVVARPGVGQVQVRDVDEPAAGLEAQLQVERAGFGDDGLAHHPKSTTGGSGVVPAARDR